MNNISLKNIFTFEKTYINIFVAFIIVGLLIGFFVGIAIFLTQGHHSFNVTREHPWGLMLATYIFLVVSSTGLCIISSLGHVFGIEEFKQLGKRAIIGAIITILSGFVVIGLEIGHPIRMVVYNIISPGITSAIWWMGALYCLYIVLICIEFFFLAIKENHKFSKIFGTLGLIFGLAAHSNLGAIFGFLVARSAVNGIFYPIYFILSAMITGCYLIFIMYGFRYKLTFPKNIEIMLFKLAKILALLLAILIFFETWKIMTTIYGNVPEKAQTILHAIKQPSFWFAEIILAILLPFFIILFSKARAIKSTVMVSITAIIGIFFMRYNLIRDTLIFPMETMKRNEYELAPTWVEYFPSSTEFLLSFGGIGLALFFYFIATKVFNLDK